MNLTVLTGRITKEIELKKTPNGKSVVSFTIAVTRDKENTDFINCVAWNTTADLLHTYCGKGSMVGIQGKIQTRNYDDANGKKIYITEVLADRIEFLDTKKKEEPVKESQPTYTYQKSELNLNNDDLPF